MHRKCLNESFGKNIINWAKLPEIIHCTKLRFFINDFSVNVTKSAAN